MAQFEIPHHKFTFIPFKYLESRSANTYLMDVVGVLISLTNLQHMKRANDQPCMMHNCTHVILSAIIQLVQTPTSAGSDCCLLHFCEELSRYRLTKY
ncbi:hypothetical protein MKW98_025251 [Papaver atlanticum]|uniref:Uncharacterized protein n=1 Tax=Papaver atlanticum TaxID=357466 RepID=A0AAD4X7R8_9MAGN|nr:hypothetical protein MKW98_025251 [Papaver atlanticum]